MVDARRPELLFEEGVHAFREGRWADAIARLSQVAAADPADEDVEAMLEADFARSDEVNPNDYRRLSYFRRVALHVARLFDPIL